MLWTSQYCNYAFLIKRYKIKNYILKLVFWKIQYIENKSTNWYYSILFLQDAQELIILGSCVIYYLIVSSTDINALRYSMVR